MRSSGTRACARPSAQRAFSQKWLMGMVIRRRMLGPRRVRAGSPWRGRVWRPRPGARRPARWRSPTARARRPRRAGSRPGTAPSSGRPSKHCGRAHARTETASPSAGTKARAAVEQARHERVGVGLAVQEGRTERADAVGGGEAEQQRRRVARHRRLDAALLEDRAWRLLEGDLDVDAPDRRDRPPRPRRVDDLGRPRAGGDEHRPRRLEEVGGPRGDAGVQDGARRPRRLREDERRGVGPHGWPERNRQAATPGASSGSAARPSTTVGSSSGKASPRSSASRPAPPRRGQARACRPARGRRQSRRGRVQGARSRCAGPAARGRRGAGRRRSCGPRRRRRARRARTAPRAPRPAPGTPRRSRPRCRRR